MGRRVNYRKEIVCLANSRKTAGRCVAGIEHTTDGWGDWIRPVSARPTEEISAEERHYENGLDPVLLDTISIPFLEARPHGAQQENHLIDADYYWEKTGNIEWCDLEDLVDEVEGPLWLNGACSYNGLNDQIPEDQASQLENSLVLVRPDTLEIAVRLEGYQSPQKRKVRACFSLNGHQYRLMVTDPVVTSEYLQQENGTYTLIAEDVYMCVSIGEPFHGYCYKLVASIIRRPE